jgi:hypothetical protein
MPNASDASIRIRTLDFGDSLVFDHQNLEIRAESAAAIFGLLQPLLGRILPGDYASEAVHPRSRHGPWLPGSGNAD